MPITVPPADGRRYDQLLADALARIPVHNPDWTNFNRSDPGVTLLELFAFLTETLLYRVDQIPERNRRAFLTLLSVPLHPAQPARGIATISNDRGALQKESLDHDLELWAGNVPFRTGLGLDVLPVQGYTCYKRPVPLTDESREFYRQLYASFLQPTDGRLSGPALLDPIPYETAPLAPDIPSGVDLVSDTADSSLWVALLARTHDEVEPTRSALAGATLNLGLVPVVEDADVTLPPVGTAVPEGTAHLEYQLPKVASADGRLPADPARRVAAYQPLVPRPVDDVNALLHPGIVQLPLPPVEGLRTWTDLEPLEEGADEFPPVLDDMLAGRVVTWLRIRARSAAQARLLWAGVNAVPIEARRHIADELLADGDGRPDQARRLAHTPVVAGSVRLTVTPPGSRPERWQEIDDLLAAGPEVPVPDITVPPGAPNAPGSDGPVDVFTLDAEAGTLRFGDGLHGRRPPAGATLHVAYDAASGTAANVGPGAVNVSHALPPGMKVTNPVRTWGGADTETVRDGERQVARYLQHRDRLVTAEDFATITRRTPGVEVGRVEVLPAYDPRIVPSAPGDAPGAVTLLLIPRRDARQPEAPVPDRFFMDSVCRYLDPRRLVTTELFLRSPVYVPVHVSVGVDVLPGHGVAEVTRRVRDELARVLSPLPLRYQTDTEVDVAYPHAAQGWPLHAAVTRAELIAWATRVPGVRVVRDLLLGTTAMDGLDSVPMAGLQLPRLDAFSVVAGDPVPLDQLQGAAVDRPERRPLPVPRIPEAC
ncbi:hypothetical protein [Streptomyces sp. NPDC059916]|uniref:hypothetical protein n=1 Tax=Streptomyces sp. NPDC059916 TaxID=3347001 RepID=UPI0036942E90